MGCGNSVSFCKDIWDGPIPLANKSHRLFSIFQSNEATVAQMGEWRNGTWYWNLSWRRRLFLWEEDLLTNLLKLVEEQNILAEVDALSAGWIKVQLPMLLRHRICRSLSRVKGQQIALSGCFRIGAFL